MTSPTPLSLPMRVKAFLAANPDEQLTAYDISVKFSTQHKNVHTQLARAVDSGELIRSRNDDGDYVYTAGTCTAPPAITPAGKGLSTDAGQRGTTPKKPRPQLIDVDLCSLPVATDIPLPEIRHAQTYKANEALDRLAKPGQSFGVPLNANGHSAIRKAITERHKAGTHRYVVRTLENEFRIWRKA